MKIAFVGDKTATAGFKALGLDVFVVPSPAEAATVWKTVAPGEYAVIFFTENEYRELYQELEPLRRQRFPVLTVLPPVAGHTMAAQEEIRALVERAVGTDVLFR